MRILVVGGGAREHALVWKIAQSSLVKKIFCAPGNAGIAQLAECVPIQVTDIKALAAFASESKIDLTVIGPEVPLVAGVVDVFEAMGLPVFGPSKEPAKLEGSKAFSKEIMRSAGIPTADFWTCHSREEAAKVLNDYYAHRDSRTDKIVIKADGIAAGKGVTVANNRQEADEALDLMMNDRVFGASGDSVVIEECLVGEEASIMAITDGATVLPLIPSQDHKRIFEDDLGANTGGMGAYTPVPVIPENTTELALERIIKPAINAIRELGIPYRGILYAGVIVTADGPKCIEFNCRLGDPETEVVLPMMECDLVALMLSTIDCTLDKQVISWKTGAAACIVAASGGYPGDYKTGLPISGLKEASEIEGCTLFHAGTSIEGGKIVTSGGRVLCVTGQGEDLISALARAYTAMSHLHFEGIYFRRDIASRVLRASQS